jgi:CubicO group peptidase (beta-lactamase class C family)
VGFADPLASLPMREDALFQTYSSTKVVTAVALLMVMEEGLIRLEDPIARYFTTFKDAKVAVRKDGRAAYAPRDPGEPPPPFDLWPAQRDVTVMDLATHTAGLMSSFPHRVGMQAPERRPGQSLSAYAAEVGPTPLDFEPGSRWSYSPLVGADVLAGLVELVAGQPFDQFIRERIFIPLGMDDTTFNVPAAQRPRLLPVFHRKDDAWARTPPSHTTAAAVLAGSLPAQGSMGLVSTCSDLLKLQQMLLDHGRAPDGRPLLGARTVALMGANLVGDLYRGEGAYHKPMYGHGFGILVQVVRDPIAGETGRSPGAFGWGGYLGTMNWTDPAEEIAGVIMLQQNNREAHIDYERAIRQAIAE